MWGKSHKAAKRFPFFLSSLACLLATLLTSCVTLPDPETAQEYNRDTVGVIGEDSPLGQSLISRRARLNGVYLWLQKESDSAAGTLTIQVYSSSNRAAPLLSRSYAFDQVGDGPFFITFPPQGDKPNQRYDLLLSASGGEIRVRGANFDATPDGTAFRDDIPLTADLAYRLTYDYDLTAALADLGGALPRLWLALPLAIILLLPGWLALDLSGLRPKFDLGEQIALSVGLSLAITPLFLLWSTALGLAWNGSVVWGGAGALAATATLRIIYTTRCGIRNKPLVDPHKLKVCAAAYTPGRPHRPATFPFLAIIFGASLFVRQAMTRDLAAPPWVDAVHHATITRIILENGRYPETFAPYIQASAYLYHAGFHSILATFTWLSHLDLPEGMLLIGEVLNAASVFAVYLLTTSLTRRRAAGVIAALFTGLFTPMPAYLTSWGRYTQLAGMLILPTVIALSLEAAPRKRHVLAGIAAGGLFLVHYRVAAFAALLLIAVWLTHFRPQLSTLRRWAAKVGWISLGSGGVALLLTLPWAWRTWTEVFVPLLAKDGGATQTAWFGDFSWKLLTAGMGQWVLVLACVGLGWAFLRRRGLGVALLLWAGGMLWAANSGAGGGMFVNNTAVEIILFMPISLLAGFLVGEGYTWVGHFPLRLARRPLRGGLILGLGILSLLAAGRLIPVLNYNTFLFRSADLPAMTWIAENVPESETVLINPFLWGYGAYAGADGGFWISALAGRNMMPPPVLYSLGADRQRITVLCQAVIAQADQPRELYEELKRANIRFVYLGRRGGVLSPARLKESGLFIERYAQGGTWVFEAREKP